jgi:hypothetical protein
MSDLRCLPRVKHVTVSDKASNIDISIAGFLLLFSFNHKSFVEN